ncbi:MAG: LysR family transcriptional regulator, partial [Myxococcota bacterium]
MDHIDAIIGAHSTINLLPHLVGFLAVAELGSFTAAGRHLGVDKTLLSRRVKALEDTLETRLLHRTTRQLQLTDAGRALIEATREPALTVLSALRSAGADDVV